MRLRFKKHYGIYQIGSETEAIADGVADVLIRRGIAEVVEAITEPLAVEVAPRVPAVVPVADGPVYSPGVTPAPPRPRAGKRG